MNFKRKHYRSSSMKRCSICGSQRRIFGENEKYKQRLKLEDKEIKYEI